MSGSETVVHLHKGILCSRKKEVWIEQETIMLSETNQSVKDKYYIISVITNLINRKQKKTPKKPSKIEPEAWKQGTN